jgi:hypothetical protein
MGISFAAQLLPQERHFKEAKVTARWMETAVLPLAPLCNPSTGARHEEQDHKLIGEL